LTLTERLEVESYLGTSLNDANHHPIAKKLLDILEAIWLQQALKERHFDAWIMSLSTKHSQEVCMLSLLLCF
jgi:hypothetical protein